MRFIQAVTKKGKFYGFVRGTYPEIIRKANKNNCVLYGVALELDDV